MKEGYIKLKIAELNDKCKQIDQIISMEKSKLELLEERVGGFKDLIKKLQDIDNFKDNLHKQIKKENQDLLEKEIKNISKKVTNDLELKLIDKIKEIEKIMDFIKNREEKLVKQSEKIADINEKINYLLNHNNFLMMKLVNKGVISDREVNELHLRSRKKSQ
jgi:DNA repair exonuclease SbcCD ATPase subunit